jgi:hypothetical protein
MIPGRSFRASAASEGIRFFSHRNVQAEGNVAVTDIARAHAPQAGFRPALLAIQNLIAEYHRAVAAEAHYSNLKRMSRKALAHENIVHGGIPRRVFEAYYSSRAERNGDPAPRHAKNPAQV